MSDGGVLKLMRDSGGLNCLVRTSLQKGDVPTQEVFLIKEIAS